jgi:Flp pilus assembly protein TadD
MTAKEALAEFKQGVALLKNGYPQKAVLLLRSAVEVEAHNPYYLSFLGLSIARADKKWKEALNLCETALQLKKNEAQFYLNLAEVYATSGRRSDAIDVLDRALEIFGTDARLKKARTRVEKRRSPVVPFLSRQNFVNRGLGKLRHRAIKHFSSS